MQDAYLLSTRLPNILISSEEPLSWKSSENYKYEEEIK